LTQARDIADWSCLADIEAATQNVLDSWESGDPAGTGNDLGREVFGDDRPGPKEASCRTPTKLRPGVRRT
jgi:hypothetical protein